MTVEQLVRKLGLDKEWWKKMSLQLYMSNGQTVDDYIQDEVKKQIELRMYELLLKNLTLRIEDDRWSTNRWEVTVNYDNKLITSDSFAI